MCVEDSTALFHLVPWGWSCIQTTGIKSSQLTLFNCSPINLFGTTNLIWYSLLSAHNMLYDAAKFWLTLKARWTSSIYHYFMTFDLMFCFVLWFLLLLICTFFCLLLLLLLSLGICNSVCVFGVRFLRKCSNLPYSVNIHTQSKLWIGLEDFIINLCDFTQESNKVSNPQKMSTLEISSGCKKSDHGVWKDHPVCGNKLQCESLMTATPRHALLHNWRCCGSRKDISQLERIFFMLHPIQVVPIIQPWQSLGFS